MGSIRSRFALLLVGVALAANPALASPWGQNKGDLFQTLKIDYYDTGEERGDRFRQFSMEGYAEYGLADAWTIGGKAVSAYQEIEAPGFSDSRTGLVEAEIFGQRSIPAEDNHALALRLGYSFPTETQSLLVDEQIDGRDGAIELSGLWGYGQGPSFIASRTGLRASLGDDSDDLRFDLTFGRHLGERSMVLFDLYTTISVIEADKSGVDYDLVSAAPSFVTKLWGGTSLQLGARYDLWGDGLETGAGAFVALWFE